MLLTDDANRLGHAASEALVEADAHVKKGEGVEI